MTFSQWEHPEAVAEFDAAVHWYEEQEQGIGLALIDRAAQARHDIASWPNAAPLFTTADDGTVIRSKAVRGSPYRIVYVVDRIRSSSWPMRTNAANPAIGYTA